MFAKGPNWGRDFSSEVSKHLVFWNYLQCWKLNSHSGVDLVYYCLEERVKVPWPVSAREALLHYFELEYVEDDLIIVLINTVNT